MMVGGRLRWTGYQGGIKNRKMIYCDHSCDLIQTNIFTLYSSLNKTSISDVL